MADDKVVYTYVPEIIRYYLDEEPILPNVPSYLCMNDTEREYVLANLDKLVVKPANESGGYGMLIGPRAPAGGARAVPPSRCAPIRATTWRSRCSRSRPRRRWSATASSRGISTCGRSSCSRKHLRDDRRADARGAARGSLVVNSSQGGGSKDTWIVEDER